MSSPDLSKLRIDRAAPAGGVRARARWGRWLFGLAVIVVAGGLAWMRASAPPAVELVTVVSAWPSQNYTLLNATGYVVPQRKAALSSKATGRLVWLGVLEGSRVKAGEVIARLESRDVSAQLDQAAAQLNVARANYEQGMAELRDAEANLRRSTELLEKKFISGAQHDSNIARHGKAAAGVGSYKAAIAASEAARRVAEVALEQTVIRAPFDAVVLTKTANVGDNITPFSSAADSKGAVVTIADMATLEVEADVSESNISKIRVDQPCEIQLDALSGMRFAGVVSRTVPTVDRSKATVLVKVRFVDRESRVLPEMSAKVAFLDKPVPDSEKKPVIAVQPGAIVERGGKKLVFVVRDGTVRTVEVVVGGKVGELVELAGVQTGDKLVLNPAEKIRDGISVVAAKK